jgi:hypothetical protein
MSPEEKVFAVGLSILLFGLIVRQYVVSTF